MLSKIIASDNNINTAAMYIGFLVNLYGPLRTRSWGGSAGDNVPFPRTAKLFIDKMSNKT